LLLLLLWPLDGAICRVLEPHHSFRLLPIARLFFFLLFFFVFLLHVVVVGQLLLLRAAGNITVLLKLLLLLLLQVVVIVLLRWLLLVLLCLEGIVGLLGVVFDSLIAINADVLAHCEGLSGALLLLLGLLFRTLLLVEGDERIVIGGGK